jgi:hypothetical protein
MCDLAEEAIDAIEATKSLMLKAHDDHCACEQKLANSTHTLTVIAEACEEIVSDLNNGHDAPSLADFARATAVRAREAIQRASR